MPCPPIPALPGDYANDYAQWIADMVDQYTGCAAKLDAIIGK